ncbi:MAG: thioredoxin family protein [Bacteroidota bacterium]
MRKLFVLLVAVGAISTAFVKKDSTGAATMAGDGIKFKGMTLDEAKAEAKATGKIIFIDAYTEWCGPCKKMAASSFMDDKVADLFNSKFINIKIEMEKSTDGPGVARAYGVKAYPTLLFIDAQGMLKKQVVGFQTADQLVALAKSM